MSIDQVDIFNLKGTIYGDEQFEEHYFDDMNELKNSKTKLNTFSTQANALADDLTTKHNTVVTKANEVQNNASSASVNAIQAQAVQTNIENNYATWVSGTTYSKQAIDDRARATFPYNGYTQVSTRESNFVFKEDSNFTYKVADKNRYVKIGDVVVDTYGPELIKNDDFNSDTTGWGNGRYNTNEVIDGMLKITSNNGVSGRVCYSILTEIGKTYKLTGFARYGTTSGVLAITNSSDGGNPYSYVENLTNELGELTFVATAPTTYVAVGGNSATSGTYVFFDNISVREIQTLDFSNTMPDVTEIITDGSNTTSVAASKGKFVILKHNFNFDTDISSWIDRSVGSGAFTWDSDSQSAKIFRVDGSNNGIMATSLGVSSGKTVALAISIASGTTATGIQIRQFNTSNNDNGVIIESNLTINGGNTYNISYTSSSGFDGIEFRVVSSDGTFALIEKLVCTYSDTFRATRDTSEMFDYDDTETSVYVETNKTIVYHTGSNTVSGVQGHFYLRKGNNSIQDILNTSAFDIPTLWQDLGTASNMSLSNPYFEKRDYVSNQALAVHRINTLTNSYDTFTEIVFDDISKLDLLNIDTVMLKAGYSKVGEYLFRKGTYLVTPIGLWQSLNKGAYHPFLNPFGCSLFEGTSTGGAYPWNNSNQEGTSYVTAIATCFKHILSNTEQGIYGNVELVETTGIADLSISFGQTGSPQSKFYDIVYPDQFIDLRCWAKILTNDEQKLIVEDKKKWGVEETSVFTKSDFILFGANFDGVNTIINSDSGLLPTVDNASILLKSDSRYYKAVYNNDDFKLKLDSIHGDVSSDFTDNNATSYSYFILTTKPILSSSTKLSIDLIGNPANYPQILKDRLTSGVGCVGLNSLLVGQDGTDYVSTLGTTITSIPQIIYNKKVISGLVGQKLRAGTYTSQDFSLDSVNNIDTLGHSLFADDFFVRSYVAKNNPYIQCDPNPVIDVVPKVFASNSHSTYKGADVANQITGKIATGNGTNGLESKYLENVVLGSADFEIDENITAVSVNNGDTILLKVAGTHPTDPGLKYNVYKRASGGATTATVSTSFGNAVFWEHLGFTDIRLQHNAIQLDNEGSATAKWFEVAEQGDNSVLMGMYGKEIIFDDATWNQDGTPTNTYGDNGEFEQLTNGTITDTNSNTIKTFHGVIPLYGKGH